MKTADFQHAIDRLGEDLGRWPDELRREAAALMASDPQARTILAEAEAMRAALVAGSQPSAPRGLVDRIMAAARDSDAATAPRETGILTQGRSRPARID